VTAAAKLVLSGGDGEDGTSAPAYQCHSHRNANLPAMVLGKTKSQSGSPNRLQLTSSTRISIERPSAVYIAI
jgi:hypothetical protein